MTGKLNDKQQKLVFTKIVEIYDLAQGVLDIIDHPATQGKDEQVDLALPIVEEMGQSADVMVNSYMDYLENNQTPDAQNAKTIEGAIRSVFSRAEELIEKLTHEAERPVR